MKTVTGPRLKLERRLAKRGVTWESVRPAIVGPVDADPITVDVDHAAYPSTTERKPNRLVCIHRGDQIGFEQCRTCAGNVTAKVFAWAIHDKCTLFAKPLSVRSCHGCGDRRVSVADQASGIEHASTVDQVAVEGQ